MTLLALPALFSCGEDEPGACRTDDDCRDGLRCDPGLGCVPIAGDGDADSDSDTDGDTDSDGDADADADADSDADGDADPSCNADTCEPGQQCVGGQCVSGNCQECADAGNQGVCCEDAGQIGCVDLLTDPRHCGRCGVTCGAGRCLDGACQCDDAAGGTPCEGRCVDTSSDPTNCGECGRACTEDAPECVQGQCSGCPSCNDPDVCIDLSSDPLNCGACGWECGIGTQCIAGECTGGTCEGDCGRELPVCCLDKQAARCRNLSNDPFNCGGCGISCGQNLGCVGGRCGDAPN